MATIVPRPVDIHAKTRLQHMLGRHCRDEDMELSDEDFLEAVMARYNNECVLTKARE